MIYIGAEQIISALGNTAEENFQNALSGNSGVQIQPVVGVSSKKPFGLLHNFKLVSGFTKVESMCIKSGLESLSQVDNKRFNDKWLVVISTTKGDVDRLKEGDVERAKPTFLAKRVVKNLPIQPDVMVVSNACISGLAASITAHDLVKTGAYNHALVIGADAVTEFTVLGFESFYALSDKPSAPFDKDRKGLSLGEAVSSVVISDTKELFKSTPVIFSGGVTTNDANHISGPSRTAEGLVRAIDLLLQRTKVKGSDIDFISAHGTGTLFNDDMESIAFTRCNLNKVPTNSMKGYFGHTLGAAGVLELSMSMQSMRQGQLIKTIGCTTPGTVNSINVLLENQKSHIGTVLKTASGFGGCNAAVILKTLSE